MRRENNNKSISDWLEDIGEEIEIQFYGIIGAIFFFVLIYLLLKPSWMSSVIEFFYEIK